MRVAQRLAIGGTPPIFPRWPGKTFQDPCRVYPRPAAHGGSWLHLAAGADEPAIWDERA